MLVYLNMTVIVYILSFTDWYLQSAENFINFFVHINHPHFKDLWTTLKGLLYSLIQWGMIFFELAVLKFTFTHLKYVYKNLTTIDFKILKSEGQDESTFIFD